MCNESQMDDGYQLKRWRDEIEETSQGQLREKSKNRILWKNLGESFVQKWTETGLKK